MARFHDVDIYRGTRLVTTSTRLEVAAKSPYLHQLLTSIKMCDGCKEPTTLIFPPEDETRNTLKEVFKSVSVRTGQSRYSIVESNKDILINPTGSVFDILLLPPGPQAVSALRVRLGETGGGGGSRQGSQSSSHSDSLPAPVPSLPGEFLNLPN